MHYFMNSRQLQIYVSWIKTFFNVKNYIYVNWWALNIKLYRNYDIGNNVTIIISGMEVIYPIEWINSYMAFYKNIASLQ